MKNTIIAASLLAMSQSALANNINQDVVNQLNDYGKRIYEACQYYGNRDATCESRMNELLQRLSQEVEDRCDYILYYSTEEQCLYSEMLNRIKRDMPIFIYEAMEPEWNNS